MLRARNLGEVRISYVVLQPPGIFRTVARPPSLVAHKKGMRGRRTAPRTGQGMPPLSGPPLPSLNPITPKTTNGATMNLEGGKERGRGGK